MTGYAAAAYPLKRRSAQIVISWVVFPPRTSEIRRVVVYYPAFISKGNPQL